MLGIFPQIQNIFFFSQVPVKNQEELGLGLKKEHQKCFIDLQQRIGEYPCQHHMIYKPF